MNKVFIAILAMCLISAEAFVRREAEAPTTESALAAAQKKFEDIAQQIKEALNPEKFKAVLDKANEETKNIIDQITKKKE